MTKTDKNKLKRWSKKGQRVFKEVYSWVNAQEQMSHPDMKPLPKEQWKTLCWNFAWLAADAADGK